jgi:hypothetical protein
MYNSPFKNKNIDKMNRVEPGNTANTLKNSDNVGKKTLSGYLKEEEGKRAPQNFTMLDNENSLYAANSSGVGQQNLPTGTAKQKYMQKSLDLSVGNRGINSAGSKKGGLTDTLIKSGSYYDEYKGE